MKIVEITRGHITIEIDGKTLNIYGEGFVKELSSNDTNYVDFVIYTNTLSSWNPPWESLPLDNDIKLSVVEFVKEEFIRRKLKLAVE